MSAKHTPGPWTFNTASEGWCYYIAQADGAPYTQAYSDVADLPVSCRTVVGEDKYIQLANARLIAAAPDLLKALELVWSDWNLDECESPTGKIVRAAIAKAKGESA